MVSWVSFLVPPEVVPGRMAMLITLFLVLINIFNSGHWHLAWSAHSLWTKEESRGVLKYEGGATTKRRPYFLGNLMENTTETIDRRPNNIWQYYFDQVWGNNEAQALFLRQPHGKHHGNHRQAAQNISWYMIVVWNTTYIVNQRTGEISWFSFISLYEYVYLLPCDILAFFNLP